MAEPVFTVGDVIRKLRKERRWSIRKLAAVSGIGRMTISGIERNQSNYQRETLDALATAFEKTSADLEALVTTRPPPRRPPDSELAPEWLAFTRRVMRLNRQAQGAFHVMLLAFEEAGAVRTLPDSEPLPGPLDEPTAP